MYVVSIWHFPKNHKVWCTHVETKDLIPVNYKWIYNKIGLTKLLNNISWKWTGMFKFLICTREQTVILCLLHQTFSCCKLPLYFSNKPKYVHLSIMHRVLPKGLHWQFSLVVRFHKKNHSFLWIDFRLIK
jgi:hypothetical protein